METDNKKLLLAAIDDYPKITESQKELLKTLLTLETEVNATTIIEVVKLKKQSVYPNLRKLLDLQLIQKTNHRNAFYSINKNAMYEVIEFHKKKQKLLQNSSNK